MTKDAPLPPHGSLCIGYDESSDLYFEFYLPPETDADLGFIKVFINTTYCDYSLLLQPSPFEESHYNRHMPRPTEYEGSWDAVVLPVVQQK